MPAKKKKIKPKAKTKPKKRAAAKKRAPKVKKPASAKATAGKSKDKLLGKVDHYFDKISVAAMKLGDSLKVGDTIRIEGGSVAFSQPIASMQIEHEQVNSAKKGDEVGFKVKQKVREGYRVYKLPRPLA
jgi:putative protease